MILSLVAVVLIVTFLLVKSPAPSLLARNPRYLHKVSYSSQYPPKVSSFFAYCLSYICLSWCRVIFWVLALFHVMKEDLCCFILSKLNQNILQNPGLSVGLRIQCSGRQVNYISNDIYFSQIERNQSYRLFRKRYQQIKSVLSSPMRLINIPSELQTSQGPIAKQELKRGSVVLTNTRH